MKTDVLILGNPVLREISTEVDDFQSTEIIRSFEALKQALENFRKNNGFGRGIAAIQIGIKKRILALNLGKGAFLVVNPRIVWQSQETFTLWDDCMSFPDLLVKVKRNASITVEYQNDKGNLQVMEKLGRAESELLQHEIDHLDGIMAIDRAIEKRDIIYKAEYKKNYEFYDSQVDYKIVPTIT